MKKIVKKDKKRKSLKEIYEKFSKAGRKTSDHITAFIGSWVFILIFTIVVIVWILVNLYALSQAFDPYPFILLNLTLSCLAAIQAPIIMMSQNREMKRDRERVELDYLINKRSEKEIEEIQEDLRDIKRMIRKDTAETRKAKKENSVD